MLMLCTTFATFEDHAFVHVDRTTLPLSCTEIVLLLTALLHEKVVENTVLGSSVFDSVSSRAGARSVMRRYRRRAIKSRPVFLQC